MADTALQRFGGIDVLCANAGIFPDKPFTEQTEADVDAVFALNVKGTRDPAAPARQRRGHSR